ncbi:MAG: hypothetical protein AVDCRST_MAG04-2854, partial [uncultured Acetobacteraceae bacterium]
AAPLPPRLVPPGLLRPGLGRAVDGRDRPRLDGPGAVLRHRPRAGARLLRLRADRRQQLRGRELRRLARAVPAPRPVGAAAGPQRDRHPDGSGDAADRSGADALDLRLPALPAGEAGRHARPSLGRPDRLEHGHRLQRLRGDELRHAGDAGARPPLRHGRRVHGSGERALGQLGTGRDPSRHG